RTFSRRHGVTLGTCIQGAWALLLRHHSGEDDVVFGCTVSGRPASLPGVEEMVGLFINTLPVRVRVPRGKAVGEWLRELQEWLVEMRQYDYTPLVEVQRWGQVPRGTPLFETLAVVENYPVDAAIGTRAALEIRDVKGLELDTFPLTLIAETHEEVALHLFHDERRIDGADAERMLGHLRTLLTRLVEDAGRPVVELSPLDDQRLVAYASGKVDRQALPLPGGASRGEGFVPPRTDTERRLAELWAGTLGVERVGVTDSFFELGGHSLLATRLVSRIRSAFAVELPLRALFDSPTLEALARRVEASPRRAARLPAPPPLVRRPEGEVPLSFAQQRLWFLDRLQPGSAAYNMPYAVRLTGALEVAALERGLAEILQRHEVLRTTFGEAQGRPVARVEARGAVALGRVELSGLPAEAREAEVHRLAEREAREPFSLAHGPLVRTTLLRLAPDEHVLLLTMHHIVTDGWSMGIFVRELAALYGAASRGEPSPLAELPVQYADYARWQ
ncbi:MAG TPA: condensation domain-containing protein, partial [Cystobacter sp.]